MTKCLGKLFVKKLKAGDGIEFLVKMSNRNCEDVWKSVFEAIEVNKTIADHSDQLSSTCITNILKLTNNNDEEAVRTLQALKLLSP